MTKIRSAFAIASPNSAGKSWVSLFGGQGKEVESPKTKRKSYVESSLAHNFRAGIHRFRIFTPLTEKVLRLIGAEAARIPALKGLRTLGELAPANPPCASSKGKGAR
jgi:hypothetical protein